MEIICTLLPLMVILIGKAPFFLLKDIHEII